jgi:hypothetical protein
MLKIFEEKYELNINYRVQFLNRRLQLCQQFETLIRQHDIWRLYNNFDLKATYS